MWVDLLAPFYSHLKICKFLFHYLSLLIFLSKFPLISVVPFILGLHVELDQLKDGATPYFMPMTLLEMFICHTIALMMHNLCKSYAFYPQMLGSYVSVWRFVYKYKAYIRFGDNIQNKVVNSDSRATIIQLKQWSFFLNLYQIILEHFLLVLFNYYQPLHSNNISTLLHISSST